MKYQFVKFGNKYIVKNSNGRIVDEKEKIQLENNELILQDITGCGCQKETTKKLTKNKKRLKEIEEQEILQTIAKKRTELIKKDVKEYLDIKDDVNDIIQETTKTI